MDSPSLLLRVAQAPAGSALEVGTALPITGADVVLGRSPDADLIVADRTVSRHHLRLRVGVPPTVEPLTASNGTFLGETPLPAHVATPLPEGPTRLQVGGVVFEVLPLADTEPVLHPLSADVPTDPVEAPLRSPLLEVVWDAGQCVARCGDRDLGLVGLPARLLGLLAAEAGAVVHHWDLQDALGTPHLAPMASAVRAALSDAIDAGALDEERLRAGLGLEAADLDRAALLRRLLQARRGHGYVLHLRPKDVSIRQV